MEEFSNVPSFSQSLAKLFYQSPLLHQMGDIAIKSIIILAVFVLIDAVVGRKISSTSKHLIWLNGFLCLAILPFFLFAFFLFEDKSIDKFKDSNFFDIIVSNSDFRVFESSGLDGLILILYLVPVLILMVRLLFSWRSLRRVLCLSYEVKNKACLSHLEELSLRLNILRKVTLRVSDKIESPISFGLFSPQIVLPEHANRWDQSTMTDVLLHELCHIKRLDWPTALLAHFIACIFWINPLVWYAVKRLSEESESSCDTAVLHAGRNSADYAESLLKVAVTCIQVRRKNLSKEK